MSKPIINSHAAFEAYEGQEVGISEYLQVTQEQINMFAEATLDHQWIHTDPERAAQGPFGSTIAHGYLTLSLLPYLWEQIADIRNIKMQVNYGIEKLKFGEAVKVNDKVRLRTKLNSLLNLRGVSKAEIEAKLEIEGQNKPAFTGVIIFLYHFE